MDRHRRANEQLQGRKKLLLLAELIASDEDALICDFAQYYQVLNWRGLPLRLAATLAAGLPTDSRCKMMLSGSVRPVEQQLLAIMADRLGDLLWRMSGNPDSTPPESIFRHLNGLTDPDNGTVQSYDSAEGFEAARRAALGGEEDGD